MTTTQNRQPLPEPPPGTGTLGVIEWRLANIEGRLLGVLSAEVYEARHADLVRRVTDLETDAKASELARRQLGNGVALAFLGAVLSVITSVILAVVL